MEKLRTNKVMDLVYVTEDDRSKQTFTALLENGDVICLGDYSDYNDVISYPENVKPALVFPVLDAIGDDGIEPVKLLDGPTLRDPHSNMVAKIFALPEIMTHNNVAIGMRWDVTQGGSSCYMALMEDGSVVLWGKNIKSPDSLLQMTPEKYYRAMPEKAPASYVVCGSSSTDKLNASLHSV